jgi:hypothetical protein
MNDRMHHRRTATTVRGVSIAAALAAGATLTAAASAIAGHTMVCAPTEQSTGTGSAHVDEPPPSTPTPPTKPAPTSPPGPSKDPAMSQKEPTPPIAQPAKPAANLPATPPVTPPGTPPATPPTTPAKPGTPPATPPDDAGGKSLDELLGLPPTGTDGASKPKEGDAAPAGDDPAAQKAKERLQRGLDEKELDSLLKQALAGMRTSADQLSERTDTGLSTQRVQADVVAKLDQLIEEAKRRSKSGQRSASGSSSGSKADSKQSQKGNQSGSPKPGEQDGNKPGESKSRDGSQRQRGGDGNREGEGPAPVDPEQDQAAMDESQAEWGALPERVRDLIRQGSRDRIASLYQRLTQEYYRRMAEDASR